MHYLRGRNMNLKIRQEEIIKLLNENGYATVNYLTDKLHYSSATINRDLNELQKNGLVKRTHGGVEPIKTQYVPVQFRSHLMHTEKRKIAKLASSFVNNGDIIFIDGSTTAQCMEQYLTLKKDLTVITNNMVLACNLSFAGIKTICLGGEVVEKPSMLFGVETVENASRYKVNKMFFSTQAISDRGLLSAGLYDLLFKAVAKNADEIFYLVDHEKLNRQFNVIYSDLSAINYVISDFSFPTETIEKYKTTKFIKVEE